MPFVTIDGRRVHYAHRAGGPRTIVFLHGGFGSSSQLWSNAMEALPAEWSAYAIDNFIHSEAPPEGYNVAAFAKRLAGFVAALGLDRPVVAGHSMGGVVSQISALDYPEAVGGLVLVCSGATMANNKVARPLLAKLETEGHRPGALRAMSESWFRWPQGPFFERYVELAQTAPLQAMIDAQISLIEADVKARLGEIRVPTLVMFGPYDTGRTMEHALMLKDGIAGARLAVLEESGHTPMADTPDAFNAALSQFLASIPARDIAA